MTEDEINEGENDLPVNINDGDLQQLSPVNINLGLIMDMDINEVPDLEAFVQGVDPIPHVEAHVQLGMVQTFFFPAQDDEFKSKFSQQGVAI